ncbi:hypothetical protein B9Z65_1858 [Elsinoe australis]|uniref:Uncharacterized protein n=1 Tax=Elsinoe australis TaxID=40998 RepID=A0A2P7YL73_9PEZI|nr:hypothetical protein B9Z65_1858 [Elsinoe australis]
MDSSPPLPARSSPPRANHDHNQDEIQSDYSLDLAALPSTSNSAPPSPPAMRKVDEVRSEDIDGPSDFTLHMEEWMRGTRRGKSTMGRGGTGRTGRGTLGFGTVKKGTVRGMLAPETEIREEDEGEEGDVDVEERERRRLEDTPVPEEGMGEEREGSATPRGVGSSELSGDGQAGQAWEKGRRFLQPTVEDYHSELSPGRPLSAPPGPAIGMARSPLANMERSEVEGPPVPKHRAGNDEELERLRMEVAELRVLREKGELRAQHFEEQFRGANEARKGLQEHLDRSTEALKDVNQGRSKENDETLQIETKEELEKEMEKSRREAEESRRELAKMKAQSEELRTQLEEMRESEDAELHDLRWRVKSLVEGEKRLTAELEEVKSSLKVALDEVVKLRTELDGERQIKNDLETRLDTALVPQTSPGRASREAEVQKLRADVLSANNEAADLRKQLAQQILVQDDNATKAELESAKQEIIDLRDELHLLQDLSRLDEDEQPQKHARSETTASSGEEELRTQLESAVQRAARFESLVQEYGVQMKALRDALTAGSNERQALRKEVESMKASNEGGVDSQLRVSERKRLALHGTLDEMRSELGSLRKANEEMDQRVSESLKKRESAWRTKEQEWLKERKTMVKALMRQWGREELGIDKGEEQRYQYKFLSKPVS